MGIGTLGFIKGAADTALSGIEKREAAEMERKKSIFAAELAAQTEKQMIDYREAIAAARPDDSMAQIDYQRGVKILRNRDGKEMGEVPLTASDIEDYNLKRRGTIAEVESRELDVKHKPTRYALDNEQARASIRASDASAQRARSGYSRSTGSLDGSDDGSDIISEVAAEMRYRNKDLISDLTASGVPQMAINVATLEVAATAKREKMSQTQAERMLLDALSRLKATRAPKPTKAKSNSVD